MIRVPGAVSVRRRPLLLAGAMARAFFGGRPYSIAKYPVARLGQVVAAECAARPPDVVIAGTFLWDAIPEGPWRRIHDCHNIEHALWDDFAAGTRGARRAFLRREARLLLRQEVRLWAEADAIIAIATEDAAVIRSAVPGAAPVVVPVRIAPPDPSVPGARRYDVGLVGAWGWAPNADAIGYFAAKILPALAAEGRSVCVAGGDLPPRLRGRLTALGADCPGFAPDLGAFYASCRVIAAPYRKGGGVRMKVAEALSQGCPVAGTPLAFRGLPAPPAGWIAEGAGALVAAIGVMLREGATVPPGYGAGHGRADQARALARILAPTTPSASKV
ncbi:MAG: glycosyltransferase [Rhodobacteraceae bacterium]|nr:glycosyltransferase [Paracoccaceae bacterium]